MVITIDFESDSPIYTQIYDQIVMGIATGILGLGEDLPTVRRMAADIGINMHTVNKAYTILRDEGFIKIDRRTGAAVSSKLPKRDDAFTDRLIERLRPIVAQSVCQSVTSEEFCKLCSQIYKQLEGENI
jgi:GntR family transcriptional regulator